MPPFTDLALDSPIQFSSSQGGVTFAQFVGGPNSGIIGALNSIVIPTIFALSFLVFLFGVLKYYFLDSANEDARKKGRQFVIWGLVGMVVLFSLWGILSLLLSTLGIAPGS